ncbi:conserved hypothetical protein [Aspergillus terreus NIH2624]|uniref:FAD-binding PCMH-type domain-containing protein n=1 Tax=Aspergillus terreus (strain NIH 2624 / FGSC A1156) TaxID=341663 RepID=Q0CFB1_ASPTN|nr:uncharacterized protein ATEG_07623 [Aspergillus terreus NIH2624]EAU31885.1 conserved hypothetical protein [Aspergillus terreus NIH2624]
MRLRPTAAATLLALAPEHVLADRSVLPRGSSHQCCASLSSSEVGDKVIYPGDAAYETSVHSYWAVNVQLEPACIVQPHSADDVAAVVQILTSAGGDSPCKFAVRSGGHMTWAGSNNIETGVTIDLQMMNSTIYNEEAKVASILPGARWESVYKTLEEYNVVVPGGRTGPVGVGGFLLGGGNSFHAARVGLACDNIINYEVVLASGRIVNANIESNTDLFKALKGGGNNFGIVTKYEVKAIDNANLWGGISIYDNSTTDQQIDALVKFIDNIENDPYASWIGLWQYNSTTDKTLISSPLDYTKPVAYPETFNDFYKIPNISSSTRFATLYNLTSELQQAAGYRDVFLTSTYLNSAKVLQKTIDILNEKILKAKPVAQGKDWSIMVIIQPWPKIFWQRTQSNGVGNVLGLDRFDDNMLQVLYDYSWDSEADDALFQCLCEEAMAELDDYAKSIGKYNEYIYLNYADKTQNPLRGYGDENVEYIRAVAQRYDPDGVFQTQVPGGFKVSQA